MGQAWEVVAPGGRYARIGTREAVPASPDNYPGSSIGDLLCTWGEAMTHRHDDGRISPQLGPVPVSQLN